MTDTAFGPADHAELPLGLRRHPRYAVRVCVPVNGELDMLTTYAHTEAEARVVQRCFYKGDWVAFERWNDDAKVWEEVQ